MNDHVNAHVVLPSTLLIAAYLISGALAIAGVELKRGWLTAIFKPLTTILLFVMVGRPQGRFQTIIEIGFFLSLVGDVALLFSSKIAFIVGLAGFLLAHVSYVIAFVGVGAWSPHVAIVALIFAASTSVLIKLLWKGAGEAGVRTPVIVYAAAITTMVASASSTLGGQLAWPWPAAIGAVLFYISDSSLSIDNFRRKIPHGELLTMGVYWLGQLGIALAALAG